MKVTPRIDAAAASVAAPTQVRADAPRPQQGQLPLPAGLAPEQQQALASMPDWQQLPWAGGQAPQQPTQHPSAVLPFKGGEAGARGDRARVGETAAADAL